MLQFILERYNYWIVIILMMTGLYIVFSRGNLVKKIIGLNIFQTSVFIFYITIGKIAGGTAPIFLDGHGDEGDHGETDTHGDIEEYAAGQTSDAIGNEISTVDDAHGGVDKILSDKLTAGGVDHTAHGEIDLSTALTPDVIGADGENLHGKIANQFPGVSNDIKELLSTGGHVAENNSVHDLPDAALLNDLNAKISNNALSDAKSILQDGAINLEAGAIDIADALVAEAEKQDAIEHAADGAHHGVQVAADVIYTNPLPHVLILTAIVVGVATTAVGLALAVRIREAYGTIEEDELEAADDIAEFGRARSFVTEETQ